MGDPWVVLEIADNTVLQAVIVKGKQEALDLAMQMAVVNTDVSETTIKDRLEANGRYFVNETYEVHICQVKVQG